ncbi:MAG: hypothetical protein RLY31_2801 [Bacteroidota bacterium]
MRTLTACATAVLILAACHPSAIDMTSVQFDREDAAGTLTVMASGTGRNGRQAVDAACVNAFRALLYDGIPGSQYHLPLINRAFGPTSGRHPYLERFDTPAGCKPFLTSSERIRRAVRPPGAKGAYALVRLRIHVAALRRELEHQQVIRSFGL